MNRVFKALNDPIRREILELLKDTDMNAGDIADHFNITKPSISHHLDLLKQADLVISVKNGQYVNYSLNKTVVEDIIQWLMSINFTKKQNHEIR
jgi:ArsR family transcriptional regulator, arsenate/arsenite/antimonite-responsive transcriptional repressor